MRASEQKAGNWQLATRQSENQSKKELGSESRERRQSFAARQAASVLTPCRSSAATEFQRLLVDRTTASICVRAHSRSREQPNSDARHRFERDPTITRPGSDAWHSLC